MSLGISIQDIMKSEYVILRKQDLVDLLVQVNVETSVEARKKWLTVKEVIAKYGVTRHWLNTSREDVGSVLRINPGKGKTSTVKYNEQSVIDELERQSIC